MIDVDISDRQTRLAVDPDLARRAIQAVCERHGVLEAEISLAIVDDPTIHALNRRHLAHDYPTDVLSFLYHRTERGLEGEIIVSADTAARMALELNSVPEHELLLYIVHGTLHLVGHDDHTPEGQAEMRAAEREILNAFGAT